MSEIEILLNKAQTSLNLGNPKEALSFYQKIGQYDAAIECFDVVLKVKLQNKTALYNKASSIIKSGKLKEGLELLDQLIKLDSSYKQQAKCDIDFVDIKLLNEFKEVTS